MTAISATAPARPSSWVPISTCYPWPSPSGSSKSAKNSTLAGAISIRQPLFWFMLMDDIDDAHGRWIHQDDLVLDNGVLIVRPVGDRSQCRIPQPLERD